MHIRALAQRACPHEPKNAGRRLNFHFVALARDAQATQTVEECTMKRRAATEKGKSGALYVFAQDPPGSLPRNCAHGRLVARKNDVPSDPWGGPPCPLRIRFCSHLFNAPRTKPAIHRNAHRCTSTRQLPTALEGMTRPCLNTRPHRSVAPKSNPTPIPTLSPPDARYPDIHRQANRPFHDCHACGLRRLICRRRPPIFRVVDTHTTEAGLGDAQATAGVPPMLGPWYWGLLTAVVLLSGLGWLLARLVWLPFYFGLFFFLIAGLLVGAVSFRVARPARPLGRGRILAGVIAVSIAACCPTLVHEYRHVAATIGNPPSFLEARNAAARKNEPVEAVKAMASEQFRAALSAQYPPGGPIGYARWAMSSGKMELTVAGCDDEVSISQRGVAWPIRGLAMIILMSAGLWSNMESLRSKDPVSVFLVPGEEAEDED